MLFKRFIRVAVLVLFLICTHFVSGILTGHDSQYKDITDDKDFGCRFTQSELKCVCQTNNEFYIDKSISKSQTTSLKIEDCDRIRFGPNAIHGMRNIRNVELSRIKNLHFEESSLAWDGYAHNFEDNTPSVKISVTNCNVSAISKHTFKGLVGEITFRDVVVHEIAPYAFSLSPLFRARSIEFYNVDFRRIQPQAFKKFAVENLVFHNSSFQDVPSRAFSDIKVDSKFIIFKCSFTTIRSGAFLVYNPADFQVVESHVQVLEGEGFKVVARGSVKFRKNTFEAVDHGAFRGLSLVKEEAIAPQQISFDSDVFWGFTSEFLNVNRSSFETKVSNVLLKRACDCDKILQEFKEHFAAEQIYCLYESAPTPMFEFKKHNCSVVASKTTLIVIVCVVLILVIIIAAFLTFYFKKIRKRDKYGKKHDGSNKNISLIVPDGKTYRETELHVIVERADLLTTEL